MPDTRRSRCLFVSVLAATTVLFASGCGSSSGSRSSTGSAAKVRIEAAFYPLQWMAQQVGGDHVTVSSLTKPGAEPHDLELTPRDVAAISDAPVVVYLSGLQPAVDDAVRSATGTVFDAAESADLNLRFVADANGTASEARSAGAEDAPGTRDPHFWLDPVRLSKVATAFSTALIERDPAHADSYRANLRSLKAKLADLDTDYRAGLASCASHDLVTGHRAFGYMSARYGLHQIGISGLSPDEEPSPKDLASVTLFVRAHHVGTIYTETLVSPAIARTVASETGAKTDVLDPLEGLNAKSQGRDYLEVMHANLRNLRRGLHCPLEAERHRTGAEGDADRSH